MKAPRVILTLLLTALAAAGETRVRITGMSHKSEQQMLEMMGGRLEHIRASRAAAPLADDAAFILRQLLEEDGYADAAVDWKIPGPEEIVLVVREGVRLSLGNVTVAGVHEEDAKKFAKLYAKPAETGRGFLGEAPPFREEDVETGLSYLRQELNARGHWEAEAAVKRRATDPATGRVDVDIEVRPGPLFRIGQPQLGGVDPQAGGRLISAARPFAGRTATTRNLNAMRMAVEETVSGSGYPDAQIQMARELRGSEFVPVFSITLGERVRLGHIGVEGLKRTKEERILRRVKGMEGDWYDQAAMNGRLREFLSTGAFASARVDMVPAGEGIVDVTLHFEEARARELTLGAGAGSYQGFITRATYADRNLFGDLVGLSAGLELSFLGLLGEVRLTDPWWFGSDVSATARAYALIYGREGYTAFESGLEGKLSRKFGKHYMLELLAGSSVVTLSEDGLPVSELGETDYNHTRLRLTQTLDFRDNPVLPKSGWHLEAPLEFGAAIASASTAYTMAGLSGGWFHKLTRYYDLGIGGEFAMLVPSGDGTDLRLFNGGARSVRSFPERELGPSANGYPTGGEAMWNTNVEIIRKITDSVRAVAFVDAGSLSREYGDIGSADIELAAGLGMRLELPIGPVRFEYGYNLTRDADEPNGTFHFAIGAAY
jgi:outer membrane protein assembly complex protein YaeT